MLSEGMKWSTLCHGYDDIRQHAFAYGLGAEWQQLVDGTRAGTTTLTEWGRFLDEVDRKAADELNFISKGDPFHRRLAALRAASGDYVCAASRCERNAPMERAGTPPTCALFDLPMVPGRTHGVHEPTR